MKRILVIAGGGVNGFIPLQLVKGIEARTGKPCCEVFDLIVGTSVGASSSQGWGPARGRSVTGPTALRHT